MNAPRQHPTAISGTWTDMKRQAEYVYFDEGIPGTPLYDLAEAVLVLLGQGRAALAGTELPPQEDRLIAAPDAPFWMDEAEAVRRAAAPVAPPGTAIGGSQFPRPQMQEIGKPPDSWPKPDDPCDCGYPFSAHTFGSYQIRDGCLGFVPSGGAAGSGGEPPK